MALTIIPDVVRDQEIHSLGEAGTAHEAARMMAEHDISTVVVVDENALLIGIVSERDMARRIVAADLKPQESPLCYIMTSVVDTVSPKDTPFYALRLMLDGRYRHLPVVDDGRVVGMVSIRDLRLAVIAASI